MNATRWRVDGNVIDLTNRALLMGDSGEMVWVQPGVA